MQFLLNTCSQNENSQVFSLLISLLDALYPVCFFYILVHFIAVIII